MYESIVLILFFIIIISLTVYQFIPEIVVKYLGLGSWKRQYSPGVSLTFDDGPDPRYTPLLLNILKKNNIQACFFVLGEKAEKYPHLVKSIYDDGHIIGSHGYCHQHAWTMSPLKTWRSWDKSIAEIRRAIGEETQFIRSPWGSINLALIIWCLLKKKRIVSWNATGKDWRRNNTPESIISKISQRMAEGSIVLLHDSGGEQGAPDNTIACIEQLCRHIREVHKLPIIGLQFPTWSVFRRLSFRIWEKWERLYAQFKKIKRIDDNNLFRLGLTHYQGPDLLNDKGEILATKGDIIGEIHLDNIRFQLIGDDLQNIGLRALKQIRLSLPSLVKYIANNPDYNQVKVYIGVTMLNKGVKGLGFNVEDFPIHNGYIIGFFQKIIMFIYHPLGSQRKTSTLGNKPKLVWISKEKLIEKYFLREKVLM
ncbi:MAG: polysaccharide deacetylase [Gracilibacter sp. BRH_c7a]|nr:MAG: polysaccharide deacetylase [Gracilibacter sp. BRH_c7a]